MNPTPAPVSLLPLLIFLFFVYLLPSLFLYLVANKSKTKGGWLAWIPVARLLLLCRMGRISPWWSLTAMIPVLGIVALFVLCYHMPKCLGVRWQRRLLAAIPVVGFFYIGYLAFHYKPALDAEGRVAGVQPLRTNTTQEIAAIVVCFFAAIPLVGMEVAMAVPAFKHVRATAQEVSVQNNLRQLSRAADRYFIETGETLVRYEDLVGPGKFVAELRSAGGENYETAFRVITAGQTYYSLLVPALDRRVVFNSEQGSP